MTSPRPPTRSPRTPGTANCGPTAASTRPRPCSRRSRTTTTTTAGRLEDLRNWLMLRACESGVTPIGAQPVSDGGDHRGPRRARRRPDDVHRRCRPSGDRTPEQTAVALVSAARGYHRREDKPFWWAHFDRLNFPSTSGRTTPTSSSPTRRTRSPSTGTLPPRTRKLQRQLQLTGELARGDLSREVFALYEPPAPPGMTDNPDRRAAGRAEVVEVDDPAVPTSVIVLERTRQGRQHLSPTAVRARHPGRRFRRRRCGNRSNRSPRPSPPDCRNCPTPRCSTSCCAAAPRTRSGAALPARRRRRRRHHRGRARPRLVVPRGARTAGNRQDLHRRARDQTACHRTRLAGRRGRAIARRRWRTCWAA